MAEPHRMTWVCPGPTHSPSPFLSPSPKLQSHMSPSNHFPIPAPVRTRCQLDPLQPHHTQNLRLELPVTPPIVINCLAHTSPQGSPRVHRNQDCILRLQLFMLDISFFLATLCSLQDLSFLTGIKPVPPAGEAWSPNHWTLIWEVPNLVIFVKKILQ